MNKDYHFNKCCEGIRFHKLDLFLITHTYIHTYTQLKEDHRGQQDGSLNSIPGIHIAGKKNWLPQFVLCPLQTCVPCLHTQNKEIMSEKMERIVDLNVGGKAIEFLKVFKCFSNITFSRKLAWMASWVLFFVQFTQVLPCAFVETPRENSLAERQNKW